ncbi:hypothetical protein B296_00029947 [Ensete ventricosum]|uniref:Secreted protein n=1 Tax=Ensete ventricosum TaxID=4639 RepID=A0A426Z318_ENSVE|nr:hypothetical protein B296_00029947 [Ensete ventricosum]
MLSLQSVSLQWCAIISLIIRWTRGEYDSGDQLAIGEERGKRWRTHISVSSPLTEATALLYRATFAKTTGSHPPAHAFSPARGRKGCVANT